MLQTITWSLKDDQMAMMNQSIDDGTGDFFVAENTVPFAEIEIGRDSDTLVLVSLRDHLEKQLRALSVQRNVSPFVAYQKVDFRQFFQEFW